MVCCSWLQPFHAPLTQPHAPGGELPSVAAAVAALPQLAIVHDRANSRLLLGRKKKGFGQVCVRV